MPKGPENAPDIATKIMAAMVRMPPKPHEKMKLGKSKGKVGSKASSETDAQRDTECLVLAELRSHCAHGLIVSFLRFGGELLPATPSALRRFPSVQTLFFKPAFYKPENQENEEKPEQCAAFQLGQIDRRRCRAAGSHFPTTSHRLVHF